MNKLEIKYFDNKKLQLNKIANQLIENGGSKFRHEIEDIEHKNFYEFYIDGIMLTKLFWGEKGYSIFLSDHVGIIGSFNSISDSLTISRLKNEEITKDRIQELVSNKLGKFSKEWIDVMFNEYKEKDVLIYGCRVCGDRGCGGITTEVQIENELVNWDIDEKHKYQFHLEEYSRVLDNITAKKYDK